MMGFRTPPILRAAIVKWAESQPDQPTPAPAIRAKELASKAIEKISDPAVPLEEQAHRSRRLTKGPSEFHAARIDLPPKTKAK